jgi:hypothetical protein
MSQIKRKGFTGFEYVDDETWEDAFTEVLYPLLDEAVAEYKLGSLDIFYIGYWFGRQ